MVPEQDADVECLLRQLAWLRGKLKRAEELALPRDAWAASLMRTLGHAIDVSHPLVRQIMHKHPDAAGRKFDAGKPPLDLLPPEPLRQAAHVLGHGAAKYGSFNWRQGLQFSRLYAAAARHMLAWLEGEDLDTESGCPHLAHALCELFFIVQLQADGRVDLDDRWVRAKEEEKRRQENNKRNMEEVLHKMEACDIKTLPRLPGGEYNKNSEMGE